MSEPSPQVLLQYPDLLSFLQDYRMSLRSRRAEVQDSSLSVGDQVTVELAVPGMGERMRLPAEVAVVDTNGLAGLSLKQADARHFERLEDFYRGCGRIMEGLLRSGRFRLVLDDEELEGQSLAGGGADAASLDRAPNGEPLGKVLYQGPANTNSLREVLLKIAMERQEGVLQVDTSKGRRSLYLTRRGAVQVRHDPVLPEETLGALLVQGERITAEQRAASLTLMNDQGLKQGEALMEMDLLDFSELVKLLQNQVQILFRQVLVVSEGTFQFRAIDYKKPWLTPPSPIIAYLYRHIVKEKLRSEIDDIKAGIEPILDQYVTLVPELEPKSLRLTTKETAFFGILQKKSYRVREFFPVANLNRHSSSAVLLTLADLQLLQIAEQESSEQRLARAAQLLSAKFESLAKHNYFDQLEIHWTNWSPQVEVAKKRLDNNYRKLAQSYNLTPELEKVRLTIVEAIETAYEVLSDRSRRQQYRRKQYEEQQLINAADQLVLKAEMMAVRQEWKRVIDSLERAHELDPSNRKALGLLKAYRAKA